jgi:hypothetical protein
MGNADMLKQEPTEKKGSKLKEVLEDIGTATKLIVKTEVILFSVNSKKIDEELKKLGKELPADSTRKERIRAIYYACVPAFSEASSWVTESVFGKDSTAVPDTLNTVPKKR